MPLLSSEPNKISAILTKDRVANDSLKGSDGKALRNIIMSWQVADEGLGTNTTCALIWTGAVTAAEINASTSYGVLGAGSLAIGAGGKLLIKTAASGTNTWALVTSV